MVKYKESLQLRDGSEIKSSEDSSEVLSLISRNHMVTHKHL